MFAIKWQQIVTSLILIAATGQAFGQAAKSVEVPGDPVRWYEDDSTQHDYAMTLIKEAQAAFLEAQKECQNGPSTGRQTCLKEAREQYNSDLSDARSQDTKSSKAK